MAKNIIVCADGTGNLGGTTPDTNVYKLYKFIDKDFQGKTQDGTQIDKQIVFYDNGVGTARNKFLRMLGGALGFGFETNVCDLYKYLARNYNSGDRVYFFGFSRGASTVRACNGFIYKCGLIKGKGLSNHELDQQVKNAFEIYKQHESKPDKAEALKASTESHGAISIHFMGIWDTVVALGFPKRTDAISPFSRFLNAFFRKAENILDKRWPHSFYYYKLTDNIKKAYQALAIDDERTAFWPFVWNENGREAGSVEQVWFAGMHSNVGGGYGRSGMASVSLGWMLDRAKEQELVFESGAIEQTAEDSHIHGRMYDSRDGFGIFYRYHPREIETLCRDKIQGKIQIHSSVIERMASRTANYAPGHLPERFRVVGTVQASDREDRHPEKSAAWAGIKAEIGQCLLSRKKLYEVMLFSCLFLFAAAGLLWLTPFKELPRNGLTGWVADIFDYFLPNYFDGLINFAVAQYFPVVILLIISVVIYIRTRRRHIDQTVRACEKLRRQILQNYSGSLPD